MPRNPLISSLSLSLFKASTFIFFMQSKTSFSLYKYIHPPYEVIYTHPRSLYLYTVTNNQLQFSSFLYFSSSHWSPEFRDPSFDQRYINRPGKVIKMIGEFITSCLILVLGYAYPAFQCFKTVEKNRVEIPELRFWCQYWIIVALITILEKIGDIFVSWLPMYGEMKLALFIYLWYPKTKGTGVVYDTLLRPYVTKHELDIDRSLIEFRERAWNLAIYYWHNCTELGSTKILQFLQFVGSQSTRITEPGAENVSAQKSDTTPPPSPRNTSFGLFRRSKPDKRGSSTSYQNQTPKSEAIKVKLLNQTQFIRPEDVLPDSKIGAALGEKSGVDNEIEATKLKLRRFIDG